MASVLNIKEHKEDEGEMTLLASEPDKTSQKTPARTVLGTGTAVLGAGSWGTAMAMHLARLGKPCTLWARRSEHAGEMRDARENSRYLDGFPFPPSLSITDKVEEAVKDASFVVIAVPTQSIRGFLPLLVPYLPESATLISASKGIEEGTLMRVSEVLRAALPEPFHKAISHLSGPSFAKEVAAGNPTTVCAASLDSEAARKVQELFHSPRFRVYSTEDEIGVELGGALKNVIALAVGCSDGLGFGPNARAGLLTRGLAEISRLAVHLGGNPLTLAGLAGMGDLVLTCTGDQSRNRTVGYRIGQGESLPDILASMNMVAEGVATARSAFKLAQRENVDMPITTEVYRVLHEGKAPKEAVDDLITRPLRAEQDLCV